MTYEAKFAMPPAVRLLLLLIVGSVLLSRAGIGSPIKQTAGEPVIRVLLDEKTTTAYLKIDSPYKLINQDTAEVFNAKKTRDAITIELAKGGIKAGEQLFKTKRLIIEPKHNIPFTINKQSYR